MPARKRQTDESFREALARLMSERGLSQNALADAVGVQQSHLSRLLRQADHRVRPSLDLMRRISRALDLDEDYFAEYREELILERVRTDPKFRADTYRRL